MTYTTEQLYEMAEAKKKLNRTGHPSAVTRITIWIEEERPFSEIQKIYQTSKVRPEVEAAKVLDPPPLSGKGSGQEPWRKFALQVSDMDSEIVANLSKSDIVTILRDKGIIDE